MATPAKPSNTAQFILIGKTNYTLTFSVRAMAALQQHYELNNLMEVGEKLRAMKDGSFEDLVVMFWAALQRHHPETTLEQAWELADDAGPTNLTQAIMKAVAASSPQGGRAKAGAGAAERPTRGR